MKQLTLKFAPGWDEPGQAREKLLEVVRTLCANTTRGMSKAHGKRTREHEEMTPNRYMHAVEMLEKGTHPPDLVEAAINLINASGWLKKAPQDITDADLERLHAEKPWEKKKEK